MADKLNKYTQLDEYWELCKTQESNSDKLSSYIVIIYDRGMEERGFFWECVDKLLVLILGVLEVFCEIIEERQKKKKLARILGVKVEEIAMNVHELKQHGNKIVCYGNEFKYSKIIELKDLENIQVIFGDAHLEALDDITHLRKLEKVTGYIFYHEMMF